MDIEYLPKYQTDNEMYDRSDYIQPATSNQPLPAGTRDTKEKTKTGTRRHVIIAAVDDKQHKPGLCPSATAHSCNGPVSQD